MGNALEYLEPLPAGCPPDKAEEIVEPRIVYRLVRSNPPSLDDFRSMRAMKPGREYEDAVIECQARGVSVFINTKEANKRRRRVDHLRETLICEVVLDNGAGRIQKTGSGLHCTWWPLADFDILAKCRVVE